jgi:O-antigen/teichoic acid export membrane protein
MLASAYHRFRPYLHNTSWIIGEKLVVLGLGFLTTILLARYLGPERFGTLAYATSLVALFGISGHLGLHGLVVRELVKQPTRRPEILGTTALLKFIGVLVGFAALLGYGALFEGISSPAFFLIALAGAGLLLTPFDVVDYWFNAFVKARYVALARVGGQLVFVATVLALVFSEAGLVTFGLPYLLQAVVAAALLLLLFRATAGIRLRDWRFSRSQARQLLGQGWIIYLASFFAVIYLRIDQVMLRWLSSPSELGVYAIAARLSEVWYFVPAAIVASVFPKLIELRETDGPQFSFRLQQLFDVLAILGMAIAVLVTLLAPWLVPWIFGADYSGSVSILVIHTWASVFIFMRAALSRWILIENALVFSLLTQGLGALSNVALNYILIPAYGGRGAAWATLISYAIASFFALALYRRSRHVFWMMLKALAAPVRYPLKLIFAR